MIYVIDRRLVRMREQFPIKFPYRAVPWNFFFKLGSPAPYAQTQHLHFSASPFFVSMSVLAGAETSQALRPLSSRQRVLQRSDGSSHWCQGRTEIVCGVYGPRSAPKKQERVEGAELVVLVQPGTPAPSPSSFTFRLA